MTNDDPTPESTEAVRQRLRPALKTLMLFCSDGELQDPAKDMASAVTEPGSIFLGAWSLPGGPDLVVRTLGNYPEGDMVAVYALSNVSFGAAGRLPLTQCRWLALNQPTDNMMLKMKEMIGTFSEVFARHECIEGAHFGMRELAVQLLEGIDISLVTIDLPDPLLLFGQIINRFYTGKVSLMKGPGGEDLWPLEGSAYTRTDLIAHALNVPERPEVAELLLGPLTGWCAADPLRDFLDMMPDEDCYRRFQDNPKLAGAALYGALVQWEEQGFPTKPEWT